MITHITVSLPLWLIICIGAVLWYMLGKLWLNFVSTSSFERIGYWVLDGVNAYIVLLGIAVAYLFWPLAPLPAFIMDVLRDSAKPRLHD